MVLTRPIVRGRQSAVLSFGSLGFGSAVQCQQQSSYGPLNGYAKLLCTRPCLISCRSTYKHTSVGSYACARKGTKELWPFASLDLSRLRTPASNQKRNATSDGRSDGN